MKELSLSELAAAYKAMTPGEWRAIVGSFDGPNAGGNVLTSAGPNERWASSAIIVSHLFSQYSAADFVGIAECHNAIPLLLEIAEALREFGQNLESPPKSYDKLVELSRRLRP